VRVIAALVTDEAHAAWLRGHRFDLAPSLALSALAAALIGWLPVPGFWWRMALGAAILVPLSFLAAGRWLKPLLQPSWLRVVTGLVAGGFQYVAGAGVFALLASQPRFAADFVTANTWRAAVPMHLGLVLLAFIVTAEEVLWRGVVTLPLAARFGPALGILAGAALAGAAHVPLGLPLLVIAAFAAGVFWGLLAVRTRSLVPSIVCHFLFDVMIFYVRPY
jgi:membrane protease YdiL (CAAX protease family)